jgi:hypothetical protein
MSEPTGAPEVDMTPAAVEALRARGGNLYVWGDKAGMLRARATPPADAISYHSILFEDCSIHIEQGMAPIREKHEMSRRCWRISWKRFPWPHFAVIFDAVGPSAADAVSDAVFNDLPPWP